MRSGFVSLIGRPNVGKSTLLNSIIGSHIAITSPISQTTRNIIQGIYNDTDTQIVFMDTPGIHKPINKLGRILNKEATSLTKDIDVILFLVDAHKGLGSGDKFIIESFKNNEIPVILVLNKIDKLNNEEILNRINDYKDLYDFAEIIPVSSITKSNLDDLIDTLKKYLPDNIKYYGEDSITNKSIDFLMSEIVREKVFNFTDEEVPHSITCVTDSVEIGKTSYNIRISIIVDRDSLKKIIIGKGGEMIKKIGIESRKDLEQLLGRNVYLELFVKTVKKWREKEKYLSEFGFKDFEN